MSDSIQVASLSLDLRAVEGSTGVNVNANARAAAELRTRRQRSKGTCYCVPKYLRVEKYIQMNSTEAYRLPLWCLSPRFSNLGLTIRAAGRSADKNAYS